MGSTRKDSSTKKGYFDNLEQFVAIGFDVGNEKLNKWITNELDKGGIFSFNQNEKNKIDLLRINGRATAVLKKIDVISYQIELSYNLAISQCDNVSQNPGSESCIGIW